MRKRKEMRSALTIAGADSGGGAGIQADLKTFAALGVHGTSVITCLTAQNPRGVLGIQAAPPPIIAKQLEAVFAELPPAAVKTGMLFSAAVVRTVAEFLRNRRVPLVVDPVMISTSGARLLKNDAVWVLWRELLPQATLLTPNLDEAAVLLGRKLTSVEDMRTAARELSQRFGCAVLVKGGHLRGLNEAVDILYAGGQEWLLSAPYIRGLHTHGTGCTYSAAITGYLALGAPLPRAVAEAKTFITNAIAQSQTVSGHTILNSFWGRGAVSKG